MSSGTEPITLRTKIEDALRAKQESIGLAWGAPNLWPGTAAMVAIEVVAPVFEEVFLGLDAISKATDDPEQPGETQRLADVTQIVDDVRARLRKALVDKFPMTEST